MLFKRIGFSLGFCLALAALFSVALLPVAAFPQAQPHRAETVVGGVITQSTTWDLAGSPYVMNTSVIITQGVTLAIEPGVIVQGTSHFVELRVLGTLNAIGTAEQPITVTSSDTSLSYNWLGLVVDGGRAQLRHTTVEYACGDVPAGGAPYTSNILVLNNGDLDMADSAVQHCDYGGGTAEMMVRIIDARADIHATTFSDSQWYPLEVAGANSVITLTDNVITGNHGYDRIRIEAEALMATDTTLYPQAVWQGYEFAPGFNVPATRTLTLQPGVMIANAYNAELRVYGRLNAIGMATQPVTLTAANESDSNGWPGLLFDGAFATGDLRHVTVRYAQSNYNSTTGLRDALAVRNVVTGEVRIESSQIISTSAADATPNVGIYVENSHILISDTLLSGIGVNANGYPLRIKGPASIVTLTNNTFTGNLNDRILLEADALMGQDTTLVPQTGLQGYEFLAGFNVPATRTLTLAPGVIMQGQNNSELRVYGQLNAIGTATQPITLTRLDANEAWPGLLFDGAFASGDLQYVNVQAASSNYGNASGMCNSVEARNVLTHEVYLAHSQITDFGGWCDNSGLYVENSHLVVEDTVFASKPNYAQQALRVIGNSTVLVSRSQIESNSGRALLIEGDTAFVKVVNSTIIGNGTVGQVFDAVRNTGQASVVLGGEADAGNAIYANQGYGAQQVALNGRLVATYNWWGDPTGPTHATNPGGQGEDISDRVLYTPWLTTTPVLPASAVVPVKLYGPLGASPGESIHLGIHVYNPLTQTLHDTVLIVTLPQQANYILRPPMTVFVPGNASSALAQSADDISSGGGLRWPQKNQVIWKLGEFAPGQSFDAYTHATYRWGLPAHLMTDVTARLVARNLPDPAINLDAYWNYTATVILAQRALNEAQVTEALANDAVLAGLYQDALAQGFHFYGTAYTQTLNTGVHSLDLLLLDPQRISEVVLVRRVDQQRYILHTTPSQFSVTTPTGGWSRDLETGTVNFWGDLNGEDAPPEGTVVQQSCGLDGDCSDPSWGVCVRNCLFGNTYNWLIGKYLSWFGDVQSAQACAECAAGGGGTECAACAAALAEKAADLEGVGIALDVVNCVADCKDPAKRGNYVCTGDVYECSSSGVSGALGFNVLFKRTCAYPFCNFLVGTETIICAYGDSCQTCCIGKNCDPPPAPTSKQIEVRTAHDPNALYGPHRAAPGEWITYTVEYENLGDGTAYGVYVVDQLPAQLDPLSLQINDGGAYLPSQQRIVWNIGEVFSHTGGAMSFSARVAPETISGTVLINQATVYFPSVPETTPTNDVVTFIESVSAHNQQLTTQGGVPVTFTLRGSSGAATPLTYHVLATPQSGALSGSAPTFTYTPALNFAGLDRLLFAVSDGLQESAVAEVSIIVEPGDDPAPLKVIAVTPGDGAQGVLMTLYPLTNGDFYLPTLWLQFSKPINATTLTTQTLYLTDPQGRHVRGLVVYDVAQRAARFAPLESLRRMTTYTATATTAIQDSFGHGLATDYTWHFETERLTVYLPLVLRNK